MKARRLLSLLTVPVIAAALAGCGPFDDDEEQSGAPAPRVGGGGTETEVPETAEELGFPAFATRNTTRVGGADSATVAAGVALASFPSAGDSPSPAAVTVVPEGSWQAGVAAAVLVADPVRAPILIGAEDGLPAISEDAVAALDPQGIADGGGAAAFPIGDASAPSGLEARPIRGDSAAALAAAIARRRAKLAGGAPEHILLASGAAAAFAMPAAAWAARSGDPVLFSGRKRLPKPTAEALRRYRDVPVYVLGPASVISSAVLREVSRISVQVKRVGGSNPVDNAIALARYVDGSFGWNINDPGHGFVIARSDRPLDAAAAAPLSAGGTWGPLLLTDSADRLPDALRGYLLDVKPGYEEDPTRALYNHVWVIGDQEAITLGQQASIDQLVELTRIGGD